MNESLENRPTVQEAQDEHIKEMLENAKARQAEAEEELKQLDEDYEDDDSRNERLERMAMAESKIIEQQARERSGKSVKKNNAGTDTESYFNPEMEKVIAMALEDGDVSPQERNVLRNKAQALGIDPDEMEMVLNSRLEKLQYRKQNGGKEFIENLQKEMNDVCILKLGTYGKKVEDTHATEERRTEILLSANPTSASEIKEYLYFISGKMDAEYNWSLRQTPYWKKFDAVCIKAREEYPSDVNLMSAISSIKEKLYSPLVKKAKKNIILWSIVGIIPLFIHPIVGVITLAIAGFMVYKNISKIKSYK